MRGIGKVFMIGNDGNRYGSLQQILCRNKIVANYLDGELFSFLTSICSFLICELKIFVILLNL